MNKIAVGCSVAGVIAAVIVGGAIWGGSVNQPRIEEEWQRIEKILPLTISEASYERGIFSSKYTFNIRSACGSNPSTPSSGLTVRQRIQHGPVPGFTRLGRAAIETEIETPAEFRALLKNGSEASTLLKAHTLLNLLGGGVSQISTTAIEFGEPHEEQINIKGASLQINHSAKGAIHYELNWPGMSAGSTLPGSGGKINIEALRMRGETAFDQSNPLWFTVGHSSTELKSFVLISPAITPMLGSVRSDIVPRRNTPIDSVNIAFSNINTESKTSLENGLLNNASHLQTQATVNETHIQRVQLKTSFKRFHAATYTQILEAVFSPEMLCGSASASEALARQRQTMTAALALLLTHNPEFSIDALELDMDGLSGKMAYTFGFEGITPDDLKPSAGALSNTALAHKSYANGHIEIPTAWLEKIMVDKDPTRQAQDKAMLEAMLTQAIDEGYVKREGKLLRSQFNMKQGVFKVNDKAIGPSLGL